MALKTYYDLGSSDWNDIDNWSDSVPVAGDSVHIESGDILTGPSSPISLTGFTTQGNPGVDILQTAVTQDITISAGGILQVGSSIHHNSNPRWYGTVENGAGSIVFRGKAQNRGVLGLNSPVFMDSSKFAAGSSGFNSFDMTIYLYDNARITGGNIPDTNVRIESDALDQPLICDYDAALWCENTKFYIYKCGRLLLYVQDAETLGQDCYFYVKKPFSGQKLNINIQTLGFDRWWINTFAGNYAC